MTAPRKTHGYTVEELTRMCLGKHRWPDEMSARAGAMQALEKRPTTWRLFHYRCPACGGFHLTRTRQFNQEPVTADAKGSQ